ncbi:uncharacterized protein LOC112904682 [Agrilus planipennis]|uniref:Uncharacterized protein LOC112904682 n=1 Tax=Agrilus planipennis TaxID=224129 RepID=A0A7F5R0H6_AGRPL|nr:uncharacterized protein LOC112904682 [Agrilus planipennis]
MNSCIHKGKLLVARALPIKTRSEFCVPATCHKPAWCSKDETLFYNKKFEEFNHIHRRMTEAMKSHEMECNHLDDQIKKQYDLLIRNPFFPRTKELDVHGNLHDLAQVLRRGYKRKFSNHVTCF